MTISQKIRSYEKRVEKGIKWLDKTKPNWWKKIDLNKLDLNNVKACVLGQGFRNYFNVVTGLDGKKTLTRDQALKMGFREEGVSFDNYDFLTAIWYEKIKCMRS